MLDISLMPLKLSGVQSPWLHPAATHNNTNTVAKIFSFISGLLKIKISVTYTMVSA